MDTNNPSIHAKTCIYSFIETKNYPFTQRLVYIYPLRQTIHPFTQRLVNIYKQSIHLRKDLYIFIETKNYPFTQRLVNIYKELSIHAKTCIYLSIETNNPSIHAKTRKYIQTIHPFTQRLVNIYPLRQRTIHSRGRLVNIYKELSIHAKTCIYLSIETKNYPFRQRLVYIH
jgi:hypothetical protein